MYEASEHYILTSHLANTVIVSCAERYFVYPALLTPLCEWFLVCFLSSTLSLTVTTADHP